MNKPDSVTIPIDDELWRHIVEVLNPDDMDDLRQFVLSAVAAQRAWYDYDSPLE